MGGRLRRLEQRLCDAKVLHPRQPVLEAELLERIGIEHGLAKRYADAETVLREAVALDETFPTWKRAQRRQVLAAALAKLGRRDEALEQYRLALEHARHDEPSSSAPQVAAWFLADHLVAMSRFAEALEVLPEELAATALRRIVRMTRALALAGVGEAERARIEAADALEACTSDEQRADMRERLVGLV